jgi:hypothetical protein
VSLGKASPAAAVATITHVSAPAPTTLVLAAAPRSCPSSSSWVSVSLGRVGLLSRRGQATKPAELPPPAAAAALGLDRGLPAASAAATNPAACAQHGCTPASAVGSGDTSPLPATAVLRLDKGQAAALLLSTCGVPGSAAPGASLAPEAGATQPAVSSPSLAAAAALGVDKGLCTAATSSTSAEHGTTPASTAGCCNASAGLCTAVASCTTAQQGTTSASAAGACDPSRGPGSAVLLLSPCGVQGSAGPGALCTVGVSATGATQPAGPSPLPPPAAAIALGLGWGLPAAAAAAAVASGPCSQQCATPVSAAGSVGAAAGPGSVALLL